MRTNSSHTQLNKESVQLEFVYIQVSSNYMKKKDLPKPDKETVEKYLALFQKADKARC